MGKQLAWRKWKIGALVSVFLSLCVAATGLAAGITWKAFLAILGTALVTHFGSYIKEHPPTEISFDTETTTKDQANESSKPD